MSNGVLRNKRIFISDVHMGDEKSFNPGPGYYPYVWIKPPRTDLLVKFLDEKILQSQDVKEFIILGDLFDQWVCPTEFDPTTYDNIANASQNKDIFDRLRKIADSREIKLVYVPGNHDMMFHTVANNFIKKYIPGMEYLGTGPGQGTFEADNICAAHGSMYTLFCSPDNWSNPPGGWLPLGYYISRLAAHKHAVTGKDPDQFGIMKYFIKKFLHDPELAKNVFLAIADDAGLSPESPIVMNGLDTVPGSISVQEIAERYAQLIKTWRPIPPVDTTPTYALLNEITGLDGPAQQLFLKDAAKIVIFGHTHHRILCTYLRGENRCELCYTPNKPCDFIYANSGTWVNSHKEGCTYVETQLDDVKGRHHVRLCHYTNKGKTSYLLKRFIQG